MTESQRVSDLMHCHLQQIRTCTYTACIQSCCSTLGTGGETAPRPQIVSRPPNLAVLNTACLQRRFRAGDGWGQPSPPQIDLTGNGNRSEQQQQPFNGLFSRTTWVSRYQKGKTNLDFTGSRGSEWQWHQLGHMQVCTSLQTDNHASTPPLFFYRPDALPAAQPTASKH